MSETARPWDDGADYYAVGDTDRFEHEELDECIEAELDDRTGPIELVVAGGMTVKAWARDASDVEAEAKRRVDCFLEDTCEEIAEEYGSPDGDWDGGPSSTDVDAFKAIALPALVTLLSTIEPWRCHVVGERTFTADELLAWVREHNPEWLETKP